jgi:hypothetical protein
MPQVPFNPIPSVAPGSTPQSRMQVDVSAATFGGDVGRAIEGLGGQLKSSGNELFERGIAMQTLYNHSEAQEADAKYTEAAGLLHAEYNTLQGKAAVDAYKPYIENLKKARQDIRDGLSNEASQKLFESSSNGTLGRTIFNGAGHAAGENKKYALGASTARVSAIGNNTLSFPEDDRTFRDGLVKTEEEVRAQGNLMGLSPEAIDEAVSMQKSKLWGERVKGMAKQDPIVAGKWLDDGVKRGDIRGEDIGKLTNLVQQQRNTVGARMISKQVTDGGLQWGAGQVDIRRAADAIGGFESGGRYDLQGPEVFSKKTGASRGRALGKYQVMPENLPGWLNEAGMQSMTQAEFLKSPAAQDQLFNFKFGQFMKQTGNFNDAASIWFSGQPIAKAGNVNDATPTSKGNTVPSYISGVNAILARNAPVSEKVAMGEKLAAAQVPDDPLFPEYVQQRIMTDHNRVIAIKKDDEFNNRQTIENGLMGGREGKLPTTVEELTADPKASEAWEKLLPQTQRRYMKVLAGNAEGGDIAWSDESLRKYQNLKGQAASNPADFIDLDVVSERLPNSAKRELINLQGRLKGKAEGDPRVARAMNILAPDLQAAGIDKKNKEEYYQYTGALADQLSQFAEENKRPPKAEEVQLMGRRLMQTQRSTGFFGSLFGSKTPTYQVPVPDDEAEKIKQSGEWSKMSITPTPEQIQRIYTRALYQKLYGGTASTIKDAAAPKPPVSQ